MQQSLKALGTCSFGTLFALSALAGASAGVVRPAHGTFRTSPNLPQHVVVIVQENRSVDNLFQGFPGADTQSYGYDSQNQQVNLTQTTLGAPYDPRHQHQDFVTEWAGGMLNGFDKERCSGGCPPDYAYSYVDPAETAPYWTLAGTYALADHVLQTNQGPSFPGHIYLIAGQSGIAESSADYVMNNLGMHGVPQNCLASAGAAVPTLDMTTAFPGAAGPSVYPCIDPQTIFDELDQAKIGWRYYTLSKGSLWTAPLAIKHLFNNPADAARVVTPSNKILTDISNHKLQPVSYVIPSTHNSDHPGNGNTGGPAWVTKVINAHGASNYYWPNTAIVVVWDDWGGWFDHYPPTFAPNFWGGTPDPYEYGFRVPLLAVGPTVRSGLVDHTPRTSASVLHFIEDVYGLASLNRMDAQTDDLFDMFSFGSARRAFRPVFAQDPSPQAARSSAQNEAWVDTD